MKTVKLNENSYNRLRSALINEISVGTVNNAYRKSDDIFWHVRSAFEDFYSELEESIFNLRWETSDGDMKYNPYINKIKEYADAIQEILDKKEAQGKRFDNELEKIDSRKFYDSPEADDEYLEDMELRDAQARYPKG